MNKLWYKLTDEHGQTYGGTQWGAGVRHVAKGRGHAFCTRDLIHFYSDPLVGLLHNPIHANYLNPMIWVATTRGRVYSDLGLKHGAKPVTTLYQIPVPEVTMEMRIVYAILCVKGLHNTDTWNNWAAAWLSGASRTPVGARVPSTAAGPRGNMAAAYTMVAAENLYAAANTADGARYVITAAEYAAYAVHCAAVGHAGATPKVLLDFPALAQQAVALETAFMHRNCPTNGPSCLVDPNTGHVTALF